MKTCVRLVLAIVILGMVSIKGGIAESLYDFEPVSIDGTVMPLSSFRGRVSLVVNVASRCGYTGQYAGLQDLYQRYRERGLVVLGFPSNDFGQQEPGSDQEIKHFCSNTYGVSFPMFSKIHVTGMSRAPLYDFLTRATGGAEVGWNFEKFLVGRDGVSVRRFRSSVSPEDPSFVSAIEAALAEGAR